MEKLEFEGTKFFAKSAINNSVKCQAILLSLFFQSYN